jgi:hypothetical protein
MKSQPWAVLLLSGVIELLDSKIYTLDRAGINNDLAMMLTRDGMKNNQ